MSNTEITIIHDYSDENGWELNEWNPEDSPQPDAFTPTETNDSVQDK